MQNSVWAGGPRKLPRWLPRQSGSAKPKVAGEILLAVSRARYPMDFVRKKRSPLSYVVVFERLFSRMLLRLFYHMT